MQMRGKYAEPSADPFLAANAADSSRAEFIRRTYAHLAGAVLAFLLVATALVHWERAGEVAAVMTRGVNWLLVLGAFMAVGWVADKWARSNVSTGTQYLGLALYVVADAFLFLPLLYAAVHYSSPEVLPMAGMMTALLFIGLTATVFITRKNFSFLRNILAVAFPVTLGFIAAAVIFGVNLGLLFAGAMVLLASASILYTTSNILNEYRTDQHVAASLAIFAGVALLFWYLLLIVMDR